MSFNSRIAEEVSRMGMTWTRTVLLMDLKEEGIIVIVLSAVVAYNGIMCGRSGVYMVLGGRQGRWRGYTCF